MTDAEVLIVVVAAIYLSDCIAWVGGGASVFRATGIRVWRRSDVGLRRAKRSGEPLLNNPLPPLGSFVVCQAWPGDLSRIVTAPEAAATCEARGRWVVVGGERWSIAATDGLARHFACVVRRLAGRSRSAAQRELTDSLNSTFDIEAARLRWQQVERETAWLRRACNALVVWGALVTPGAVAWWGFAHAGAPVVSVLLALHVGIVLGFRRAYTRLHSATRFERRSLLIRLLLSPPAAARACDHLTRDALVAFDPLAVTNVLCGHDSFKEHAAVLLRKARHPTNVEVSEQGGDDEGARWFRGARARALEACIKKNGLDERSLLAPPSPDNPESRSFCPRCLAQYVRDVGSCADCSGVDLARFSVE